MKKGMIWHDKSTNTNDDSSDNEKSITKGNTDSSISFGYIKYFVEIPYL